MSIQPPPTTPTLLRIPIRTLSPQAQRALEGIEDLLVYRVPLVVRFRGVTAREGLLLSGYAGWGEAAPFWDYGPEESARWLASAIEVAKRFPPVPRRQYVPVNVTIPVISPDAAFARVLESGGCATAKVKIADPGVSLKRDLLRIEAVADALTRTVGTAARIRVDVNGAWSVDDALDAIPQIVKAAGNVPLEYVEQPCASVEELTQVRRAVDVPIAADESIRRASDPLEVARREAADVAIVKVAPLGGPRKALRIARESGLDVVFSSALETSIGIASAVDAAASLQGKARACGLGTASLLAADVTTPLVPTNGKLPISERAPDETLIDNSPVDGDLITKWSQRLEAMIPYL